VAEHLGVRLVLAGHDLGAMPSYGEQVGVIGPARRAALMAGAAAVFVPTLYGGPFEGVAVEAMLSGCPVVTSDHGVFPEYVLPGDGWRCNTMAEYVDAGRAALAEHADPRAYSQRQERARRAIARFSIDAVGPQYERYFGRLAELWDGAGWGAMEHPVRQ
jgi:glycosyltransferase involved in cell wall biosynthesis